MLTCRSQLGRIRFKVCLRDIVRGPPRPRYDAAHDVPTLQIVASLDRKSLVQDTSHLEKKSIRGVFDKETRRKPLAFAADAVRYGI